MRARACSLGAEVAAPKPFGAATSARSLCFGVMRLRGVRTSSCPLSRGRSTARTRPQSRKPSSESSQLRVPTLEYVSGLARKSSETGRVSSSVPTRFHLDNRCIWTVVASPDNS
eukprot:3024392-Pleurochrysis_carterae.AAC.1